MKLNRQAAERLPTPGSGNAYYFDDTLPGFGVRVTSTGARAWIVQYRVGRGRSAVKRRVTLGDVRTRRYDAARDEARDYLEDGRHGRDRAATAAPETAPDVIAATGPGVLTLRDAYKRYIRERQGVPVKPMKIKTAYDCEKCLEHNLSDWMDKPLAEITREMVRERNREIADRSVSIARNALGYLRSVYSHFIREALIAREPKPFDNPTEILTDAREWTKNGRRTRIVTPSQLPAWWAATAKLEQDRARDYLRLLLLTGLRRNEGAALEWDDIDFERGSYRVMSAEQLNPVTGKAKRSTKNHTVVEMPLTRELRAILERRYAQRRERDRFVFPGDKRGEFYKKSDKAAKRVVALSGAAFTPHDLRRTWRTMAEFAGTQPAIVARLMNHLPTERRSESVTLDYFAAPVEMLAAPAQKVEDYILSATTPAPTPRKRARQANVVELSPRKAA